MTQLIRTFLISLGIKLLRGAATTVIQEIEAHLSHRNTLADKATAHEAALKAHVSSILNEITEVQRVKGLL